ncbi:hypothetical protein P4O66_001764 [Electrophorus voltai]|uniref:Ig-like domain-containing protein n=1 Tax=Electrophorus voltai TaxID=2609070 RepID=A0AAD8Z5Y8_9TELE|nr:hypothetical protein P4O66_001764 [Electrophorus voltai]
MRAAPHGKNEEGFASDRLPAINHDFSSRASFPLTVDSLTEPAAVGKLCRNKYQQASEKQGSHTPGRGVLTTSHPTQKQRGSDVETFSEQVRPVQACPVPSLYTQGSSSTCTPHTTSPLCLSIQTTGSFMDLYNVRRETDQCGESKFPANNPITNQSPDLCWACLSFLRQGLSLDFPGSGYRGRRAEGNLEKIKPEGLGTLNQFLTPENMMTFEILLRAPWWNVLTMLSLVISPAFQHYGGKSPKFYELIDGSSLIPEVKLAVFSTLPKDGVGVLNSPLMLHCAVYDSSPQRALAVTWEKDNGALGAGVQQMANGSLFFSQLQEEDMGSYICSAKKGSQQITAVVTVSKAYLDNVFFSPQSQIINEGQDVFFQCVSGDSSPPANISWLKNGRALTRGAQIQGQYGGGGQRKTSGTLHLVNTTKSDQGIYACVTFNSFLNISKVSSAATLAVRVMDWMFVLQPTNKTVRKGDAVTLSCRPPDSRPPAQVSWFRNNRLLRPRPHFTMETTGDLLFHRVQETDRGYYFCRASNSYLRRAVASRKIFLEVLGVYHCFCLEFFCFASSPICDHKAHGSYLCSGSVRNATLYISSVRIYDEGFYTCTASSSVGQDKKTTTLRVTVAAKPVIVWFVGSVNVSRGGTITLPCRANGNLPVKYSWTRMGLPIPLHPSPRIRVDDNGTLHISNANQSDIGEYYCTAQNGVGQDRRKAMVIVLSALRGLGGPCRHGERLAVERTYDNRAFEDDNMVAVIEQSPNTSETRACPPLSSPSTLLMEPSYDDIQEEVQPIRDLSVIVESHPETSEEEQLETSFEEGKAIPSPQSDIQLQCLEDWRSRDFSQSQEALSPSPPAQSQPPEGLRSSLTLQTSEPSSAPLHHSISISHNSSPLLLSHCISLGMTSVAVDVRFYPSTSSSDHPTPCSTFSPPGRQSSSRLEHEQTTASTQHGK